MSRFLWGMIGLALICLGLLGPYVSGPQAAAPSSTPLPGRYPAYPGPRPLTTLSPTRWDVHFPWVGTAPTPVTQWLPLLWKVVPALPTSPQGAGPAASTPQKKGAPKGFVTAQGARLVLDGKPYYFLGVNASYLMLPYFPEREIEPVLAYLAGTGGVNVVRFWIEPGQSLDRLERVLDLGRKYGLRFVIALQNYYFYKDQNWFATHYKEIDLPHVRAVVSRFRHRPEVLMWELMNEPGCGPENGSQECCDHVYRWAQEVSALIKQLDPYHLVSVGTMFRGWTKAEQDNYERLHALTTVDVVSIHRSMGETAKGEMRVAEALNKPVFVGEAYYQAYDEGCRLLSGSVLQERARFLAQDLEWSFSHGLDGYLLWQHNPGRVILEDGKTQWFCDVYSYLVGDPVYPLFKTFLERFARGEGIASRPVGPD